MALQAQTPVAFPGAVGFGSAATGGRGGSVAHVTTLADSGAGSFRTAVGTANTTVVFDVGGYITLNSAVSVANNVTIAGQTAPGGGIGIQNDEVSFTSRSNVIVRGVRFRQGTNTVDTGESAVNLGSSTNAILDHCSFEFGEWDTVDAVGAQNFTVSNCIIADPIGQQFGAHVEGGPATFYNNLWVNGHNRQPLDKCNDQYIDNVIYNYQAGYTVADTSGNFSHDIINNYFITGPSTTNASDDFYQMDSNQSVYSIGNLLDSNRDGSLNGGSTSPGGTSLGAPWSSTTTQIPIVPTVTAYTNDLANAGALPHDQVDNVVIGQVESLGSQGSILSSQASDGLGNNGYGVIASGTAFVETANDGIADYWAQANGISITNGTAGEEMYGTTGYTNLEVYINSLILPNGWLGGDIGSPAIQGASSYNPFTQTWLLVGSGSDIWSTSDQFQYASESFWGNGTISAEVASYTDTSASAKAGVMWRDTTAANGAYAMAVVEPGYGVNFQWRATDGGTALQSSSSASIHPPCWLKLVRNGTSFTGYYSTNGTSWTQIGSTETVTMPTQAQVGLADTSANNSQLNLDTFTNVSWPATIYQINNLNSGMNLDAVGAGTSPGTLLDQYTNNGNANQQWALVPLSSGAYNLIGVGSGLAVSATNATESSVLALETGSNGSNQAWTLTPAATPGYYTLKVGSTGYYMDVNGQSRTAGAAIDQYQADNAANQEWELTPQ
jgi:hypothetical protein